MDRKKGPGYEDSVFVNCPFDEEYEELFDAIVFAVHDCGFVARCALEAIDSGEARIDKILAIIAKYDRYRRFLLELTELRRGVHLDRDEKLIFVDYQMLVIGWIAANDWRP